MDNWGIEFLEEPVDLLKEISNLTIMTHFSRMDFDIEVVNSIPEIDEQEIENFVEHLLKPCRDHLIFMISLRQREIQQMPDNTWRAFEMVALNLLERITDQLATWKKNWQYVERWGYVPRPW